MTAERADIRIPEGRNADSVEAIERVTRFP